MIKNIVQKIKRLEIQGASSITLNSLKALRQEVIKNSKKDIIKKTRSNIELLKSARPTEPMLRNVLKYILININDYKSKEKILENIREIQNLLSLNKKLIIHIASKKILNNSTIYTHCHSHTVVESLIAAKKEGKKFNIINTETRPLYQGRKTAEELSKNNIPVEHYIDSGMYLAIKQADLVLLGADAITSEGDVINKIGSGAIAKLAHECNVPLYIITSSLKFDPDTILGEPEIIEERSRNEIWKNSSKKINIKNPAFELIPAENIDGIITELGVYSPQLLMSEIKRRYPWII